MLPERLSSDLCSLLPGRDRWAVTVEVGRRRAVPPYRSVVRSDHRLTYDEAERMLATGEGPSDLVARAAPRSIASPATADRPDSPVAASPWTRPSGRTGSSRDPWSRGTAAARSRPCAGGGADAGAQRGGRRRAGRAAGVSTPFRVHEPPDRCAVPRSSTARRAVGAHAAQARGAPAGRGGPFRRRGQPAVARVRAHVRPRPDRVPRHGAAGAARPATTPEPRPFRPRQPGVLPLHLADPAASGRDGAPGAPARTWGSSPRRRRPRPTWPRPPRTTPRPSARRGARAPGGRHLRRLPARARAV